MAAVKKVFLAKVAKFSADNARDLRVIVDHQTYSTAAGDW
jgi:hypothetical protein